MTSSFVGAAWQGSFPKSYWSHFDLLELPNDKVSTLKLRTVKSWLANGPDARLLVVPIEVEDVVEHPARILSERIQQFLGLSSPSILRVRTSASLRPSQKNRAFLNDVFEWVREQSIQVAWEPRGLWSTEDAAAYARRFEMRLVVDPLDDDTIADLGGSSPFFTVAGRRGFQNQLSDFELQKVLELADERAAPISFSTPGFWQDALRYQQQRDASQTFWAP